MLLLSEDSEVARLDNNNNNNNNEQTTTKPDGMWLLSEDSEVVPSDSGNTLIHTMATSAIVNPAGKNLATNSSISVFASVDFS